MFRETVEDEPIENPRQDKDRQVASNSQEQECTDDRDRHIDNADTITREGLKLREDHHCEHENKREALLDDIDY
jgi:hypothetical protein